MGPLPAVPPPNYVSSDGRIPISADQGVAQTAPRSVATATNGSYADDRETCHSHSFDVL
jgi:hypothetical protein